MFFVLRCKLEPLYILLEDFKIRWTPDWERATRFKSDNDNWLLLRSQLRRLINDIVIEGHEQVGRSFTVVGAFPDSVYHSSVTYPTTVMVDGLVTGSLTIH